MFELAQILCLSIGPMNLPPAREKLACEMMPAVIKEARKNNLRPTLLLAMIHVESAWKKTAISSSNACGLTQMLPKYTGSKQTGVPKLTCKQLQNPRVSIKMGARTLKYWIKSYGRGKEKVGLCGYNKGFRCKGANPHPRGMMYARKVLRIERSIKRTQNKIQGQD